MKIDRPDVNYESQQDDPPPKWNLRLVSDLDGQSVKWNKLTAVLTYIDFKKAFDTTSMIRESMLNGLTAYGIPEQLVNAIASTYL